MLSFSLFTLLANAMCPLQNITACLFPTLGIAFNKVSTTTLPIRMFAPVNKFGLPFRLTLYIAEGQSPKTTRGSCDILATPITLFCNLFLSLWSFVYKTFEITSLRTVFLAEIIAVYNRATTSQAFCNRMISPSSMKITSVRTINFLAGKSVSWD